MEWLMAAFDCEMKQAAKLWERISQDTDIDMNGSTK